MADEVEGGTVAGSPTAGGVSPVTVVVGLGKTGVSIARFLARRGERFAIVDSRAEPPGKAQLLAALPDAEIHTGSLDVEFLRQAQRVLLSPGVALSEPALKAALARGAEVIGDVELFARHAAAPVIAITGANGKSTVTTLVGEMAQTAGRDARVGGNLGTPALDLLEPPGAELFVLELSSFQLETVHSLNAKVAAVLNISPDHMDRYASLSEYADAKRRIFRGDGTMVLNADDPQVAAMAGSGRQALYFTLQEPTADAFGVRLHEGAPWIAQGETRLLPVSELKIKGSHNVANALAALALGSAAGLPMSAMLRTLRTFPGLPHRCQWVATHDGVGYYNDSKGTNVGAACAAIAGLSETLPGSGRLVLIAGGDGKGADFAALAEAAPGRLRGAVTIGRDGPRIEAVLKAVVPVVAAGDMDEAVTLAASLARPGDAVLLSPACASFDMYRDYVHRGETFAEAVRRRSGS
jgi:UDP-N-acetylmuramoylalanine--D-glutamate ligase